MVISEEVDNIMEQGPDSGDEGPTDGGKKAEAGIGMLGQMTSADTMKFWSSI